MSATQPSRLACLREALLELVFPAHCAACRRPGAWLCGPCLAAIPGGSKLQRVPWTRLSQGGLAGAYALCPHVYPLREAVHAFKYDGLRVLAAPLTQLLASAWQREPLPVDVLVPVPLHTTRVRQRGYNQAALLARAMAPRIGLPLIEGVLVRQRETRSQVGLTLAERQANVAGAFACPPDAFGGRRVLLVDDVLTTGATLTACASALRFAGALAVYALTLTWAEHGPGQDTAP